MTIPSRARPYRILVALANDWKETLQQLLEQAGFEVVLADSKLDAEFIIQTRRPDAVVLISDWALESDKGRADGLMEYARGEIPTLCLISSTTWQNARERWFDYLYLPPLHEYCSLPATKDEITSRLNKVLGAAASTVNGQGE